MGRDMLTGNAKEAPQATAATVWGNGSENSACLREIGVEAGGRADQDLVAAVETIANNQDTEQLKRNVQVQRVLSGTNKADDGE